MTSHTDNNRRLQSNTTWKIILEMYKRNDSYAEIKQVIRIPEHIQRCQVAEAKTGKISKFIPNQQMWNSNTAKITSEYISSICSLIKKKPDIFDSLNA